MKIKVAFLGTPEFACPTLEYLLSEGADIFEMCAVISQPDRPAGRNLEVQASRVKQAAENHLNKLSRTARKFPIYTPPTVNDPEFINTLQSYDIDVAVVVAFGQILKPDFLKVFKHGAVNIHASLLPRWRGAAPIQWALMSEDPITGVTLQKVAPKLDSGDVISASQLVLDESYDAPKLYGELSKRGADLIRRSLPDFVNGKLTPQPQDETQITLAPKITKEMGRIDWNMPASKILAYIRALTPWPGVWTTRDGKTLKVLRAKALDYKGPLDPGFIISMDKFSFGVQCGNSSALLISVVQPESRARMPVSEYLKGYRFKRGDRLGG